MATELTVNQPAQPSQSAQASAPVYGGATGAINKNPDSVVTNTAKTSDTDVGKDDAHRKASQAAAATLRRSSAGVPSLDSLSSSNVKTVVGFDAQESDHIYIRVQDANTGVEIAQIPSKEFVQFLRQRFEELFGDAYTSQSGFSSSV